MTLPADVETGAPEVPETLPLLPIRDLVVFPYMIAPIFVSREISIAAIEEAMQGDRLLFLAAQKETGDDRPAPEAIHELGTVGMIMRRRKLPDGRLKLVVQGVARGRIRSFVQEQPSMRVRIAPVHEAPVAIDDRVEALVRATLESVEKIVQQGRSLSPDILAVIQGIRHPGRLADLVASHLAPEVAGAQLLLESQDPVARLQLLNERLEREQAVQQMRQEIQTQAKEVMSQSQREYFLREQLRQIQSELGEGDGRMEEMEQLRKRIALAKMPPDVSEEASKQLRRLEGMHGDSAEAAVIRSYLDWITELPWSTETDDRLDLREAEAVLDEDHYGLDEVKERLLEYLGVRKLKADMKGPILCLAGPPGVGKTSLGKSVARAMGRSFVRVALGGVRDEAEIRGHRRTYVGAMPGRIIQAIKQAGSKNPVVLLDELDKLGQDFRGDPSAALLEVLDPEQNNKFRDHYLNVDFDLSKVLFLATANQLDPIPGPLRDRMEVIAIAGYTDQDKLHICKRHILPRQIEENGLTPELVELSDRAIKALVRGYTREAGLRNLERLVAKLCRKVARRVAEGRTRKTLITAKALPRYLGPARYVDDPALLLDEVGVSTGLAWTQAGGEILQIEASATTGKGGLILTGHLGDVMKESARAALTWARTRAGSFGIPEGWFESHEIHVHVPAGAIPKDGPSAGIAMATALVSVASGIPARHDVAMTGELTLRGRVMPIGGLKAKLLAAMRHGIADAIIPKENEKDLAEIPAAVRRRVRIHPVRSLDEVMALSLARSTAPALTVVEEKPRRSRKRSAPSV
ncbi:endopeptidase La [Vulgatibacter incomptus]|uniref:Lon protease n=1 Tax=Vulgatibacter incomptus TaxID=1391653 RepID=A0A0K1PI07_9BACT|nr:endopeptidase La [Vulgatibacter incomptus]AKU93041.1 ATP-dependent protease La [Vulgatibacter incomptus]